MTGAATAAMIKEETRAMEQSEGRTIMHLFREELVKRMIETAVSQKTSFRRVCWVRPAEEPWQAKTALFIPVH